MYVEYLMACPAHIKIPYIEVITVVIIIGMTALSDVLTTD
jgi:hypothetical protein